MKESRKIKINQLDQKIDASVYATAEGYLLMYLRVVSPITKNENIIAERFMFLDKQSLIEFIKKRVNNFVQSEQYKLEKINQNIEKILSYEDKENYVVEAD